MRIFLPFAVKDIGGTSTFARKFQLGLKAAGHEVFFDYQEEYDVLFLIVQCPLKYLLDAKRRGKPIVQRLDGTYYWSVAGWRFPLLNAKAALARHFFTDFSIYQSRYSRECAGRFLGAKFADKSAIIYNGVDLDTFSPVGTKITLRDRPDQQIFFTASAFRRPDQIRPLIEAAERYQEIYRQPLKLVIAGSFSGGVAGLETELKQLPFVQLLGKVKNDELAAYARAADVFVSTHLNPPCPNNIIEALACGLPICSLNDGAMTELVDHQRTGYLVPVKGSGFWRARPFDAVAFARAMRWSTDNRRRLGVNARRAAERRFSLLAMSQEYVKSLSALVI